MHPWMPLFYHCKAAQASLAECEWATVSLMMMKPLINPLIARRFSCGTFFCVELNSCYFNFGDPKRNEKGISTACYCNHTTASPICM
jgi:hypothetical protein